MQQERNMAGLIKEDPILMNSIASSYTFLDSLCTNTEGLTYQRNGTATAQGFPKLIDRYILTYKGKLLCEIFIYPYHNDDIPIIPAPIKEVNPNINEGIFGLDERARWRYLVAIGQLALEKNGIISNEIWDSEKQHLLKNLETKLGYEDEIESLILDEFKESKINSDESNIVDFVQQFAFNFHNKKLSKYAPDFVRERNDKLLIAYDSIIETIDRIQAWQDNDLVRQRIEINTLNNINNYPLGVSVIKTCIAPFCFITIECDTYGRYNFSYGIDSRIQDMVSENMGSTLLRRIYQFTPGELEPFVRFVSLSMDCIGYFENSLKNVHDPNFRHIKVNRNEEKSISEMLIKLELRDDLDENTKKWLRR